jgi:putative transposase
MRERRTHKQLTLESARKPDGKHGGWRPKAGRKRMSGTISHAARPVLQARFPQHVTLRLRPEIESIAREFLMSTIRACIRGAHKPDFRIVEFNVLSNHLHLVTEAASKDSLARGVQGFEVRLAKNLNSALKRRGPIFASRYHVRQLRTPTEVRFALRYVLLNRKHHDIEKKFSKTWFDPCSSAAWFDGWTKPLYSNAPWQSALLDMDPPNARATTWLLTTGWKRLGLLRIDDAPA